jgi:hypothetical protein
MSFMFFPGHHVSLVDIVGNARTTMVRIVFRQPFCLPATSYSTNELADVKIKQTDIIKITVFKRFLKRPALNALVINCKLVSNNCGNCWTASGCLPHGVYDSIDPESWFQARLFLEEMCTAFIILQDDCAHLALKVTSVLDNVRAVLEDFWLCIIEICLLLLLLLLLVMQKFSLCVFLP